MVGSDKIPMHLWPEVATVLGSLGLLDGMLKYGRSNWRYAGVRASIYYDAAKRHLNAWFEGEEADPDSGLPHLAHVLACCAILVDAEAAGKLNDDRMVEGGYRKFIDGMTKHVAILKKKHADRNPKHYTIKDNDGPRKPIDTGGFKAPPGYHLLREDAQPVQGWDPRHVVFRTDCGSVGGVESAGFDAAKRIQTRAEALRTTESVAAGPVQGRAECGSSGGYSTRSSHIPEAERMADWSAGHDWNDPYKNRGR